MIVFHRIEAVNFRSFSSFKLELDFHGTTLVQGVVAGGLDTLESNGAGKSSLFSAISWALFGKFFHVGGSLVSGEQVVKRGSFGGCHVSLKLSKGGSNITIDRYRNDKQYGNKVVIHVDEVDRTPSSNFKSQEYIESLLGVSFELFTNLVYITETSMRGSFVLESDAQRKKILVSALPQLEQFGEARGKVKSSLNSFSSYVIQCKNQISTLGETLQELQSNSPTDTEVINSQIHILVEQLQDYKDRIALLTDNLEGQSSKHNEKLLQSKIEEIATTEAQIAIKQRESQNWIDIGNTCHTCSQPVPAKFKHDRVTEINLQIVALRTTRQTQNFEKEKLRKINEQFRNLNELTTKCYDLEQRIEHLQQIVKELELRQHQHEIQKKNIQFKINNLRELIDIAETYNQSFRVWFDGFGPRGALSLALTDVISVLTGRAELWLYRLWREGATIAFELTGDDSTKIEAQLMINQQEVQLTSLSSGETRRLCLAICFGLRESLQTLTGWNSNLLVLDEVFDGVDGAGRDKVLHELQHVSETSVFVISQFPQLSQDIQRRAVVHFSNDESQLTVAAV